MHPKRRNKIKRREDNQVYEEEFMVQLQTFTTSDYLLKNICFNNNKLQN